MTSTAFHPSGEPLAGSAEVGVIAARPQTRAQIAEILASQSTLTVLSGRSAHDLISQRPMCAAIVFHCRTVSTVDLSLFGDLKSQLRSLRIVSVCESADLKSARRAVDRGVDGLVLERDIETGLSPTVTAVLAGQTVVPRELRASVSRPSLSFREKQILGMVVMGFTNGEISSRLFLAESTVKSHLSSAFTKLGVRSRNEAAAVILDPEGSLGTGILAIQKPGEWQPPLR